MWCFSFIWWVNKTTSMFHLFFVNINILAWLTDSTHSHLVHSVDGSCMSIISNSFVVSFTVLLAENITEITQVTKNDDPNRVIAEIPNMGGQIVHLKYVCFLEKAIFCYVVFVFHYSLIFFLGGGGESLMVSHDLCMAYQTFQTNMHAHKLLYSAHAVIVCHCLSQFSSHSFK